MSHQRFARWIVALFALVAFGLLGTSYASADGTQTISGTLNYTRVASGPDQDDVCDPLGDQGTSSVNENWQLSIPPTAVPVDEPPLLFYSDSVDTTATITGSFDEVFNCPEDNETDEFSLTQPGTMTVALASDGQGHVFVSNPTDQLDGSDGGLGNAAGGGYAPDLQVTVPAVSNSTTPSSQQVPIGWTIFEGDSAPNTTTLDDSGTLTGNITAGPVDTTTGPGDTTTGGSSPIANCDAYWVKPNQALSVKAPGVLANDQSNGNGSLSTSVDHISFGVSSHPYQLSADGALRFRATQPGTATITYHDLAADGETSGPTQALIYIQATKPRLLASCAEKATPPKPPVARDDYVMLKDGKPVTYDVLVNDTAPSGDRLKVVAAGSPAHGKARCLADGPCTYTPGSSFSGKDNFSYTISDGHDRSSARVYISTSLTTTQKNKDGNLNKEGNGPPPPQTEDDAAWVCGSSLFNWYDLNNSRFTDSGSNRCVYLFSNNLSQLFIQRAQATNNRVSTVITDLLSSIVKGYVAAHVPHGDAGSGVKAAIIDPLIAPFLPQNYPQDYIDAVKEHLVAITGDFADQAYDLYGKATGPIATFLANQYAGALSYSIIQNGGCFELAEGVHDGKLGTALIPILSQSQNAGEDSSGNPLTGSIAHIFNSKSDAFRLNMRCDAYGDVVVRFWNNVDNVFQTSSVGDVSAAG